MRRNLLQRYYPVRDVYIFTPELNKLLIIFPFPHDFAMWPCVQPSQRQESISQRRYESQRASYTVVQNTPSPLKILIVTQSNIGGLAVIMTCSQADICLIDTMPRLDYGY